MNTYGTDMFVSSEDYTPDLTYPFKRPAVPPVKKTESMTVEPREYPTVAPPTLYTVEPSIKPTPVPAIQTTGYNFDILFKILLFVAIIFIIREMISIKSELSATRNMLLMLMMAQSNKNGLAGV